MVYHLMNGFPILTQLALYLMFLRSFKMKDNIKNLLDLTFKIKKKPHLYLESKKNLSELYYILEGFSIAYIYEKYERDVGIIPNFDDWIHKKYNNNSTQSWKNILLENSKSEKEAFDLFFEELENFLKENNIEVPTIA